MNVLLKDDEFRLKIDGFRLKIDGFSNINFQKCPDYYSGLGLSSPPSISQGTLKQCLDSVLNTDACCNQTDERRMIITLIASSTCWGVLLVPLR